MPFPETIFPNVSDTLLRIVVVYMERKYFMVKITVAFYDRKIDRHFVIKFVVFLFHMAVIF